MFCEKCGAKLSEGAAFCEKCGAPVGNKKEESETSKKTVAEKKVKPVKQEKKSGEKKPHKKSKAPLIIGAAAIVAAIAAVIFFVILPGHLTASTIFLTDYDGDVTLSDADGKELKLSKDRQMADGNELDTEEESKAYVTLDEERFVTLMQLSHAAFMQNGRKMRLELEEGSLFFNVARVLE
ncbi:MAG: zinc-ribbon domain-containing protein, partial [Lachnospiraceae bacterium]|nr:zinc-ribbon domain-containing protein [Lachnospiraceae bacterium]